MSQGWKFGASYHVATVVPGTPNISLETAASEYAEIMEFYWGGEVTSSNAMRTGCYRAAEGTGGTAVTPVRFAEQQQTPRTAAMRAAYSVDPAPEGVGFFVTSWNAHGGVIRWLAAPGEEIIMLGVSTVILENPAGAASASTYGFVWGER